VFTLFRSRYADLVIAVLLFIIAGVATWTAYSYSRASGLFPIFTGWLFLALTGLEIAVQVRKPGHSGADIESGSTRRGMLVELGGPIWLGFLLLVVYIAGFLVAIPLFLFLFLYLAAERTVIRSAVFAILATVLIYGVFAGLLEYRLFAGVLFDT